MQNQAHSATVTTDMVRQFYAARDIYRLIPGQKIMFLLTQQKWLRLCNLEDAYLSFK
jgi:hypothetical protein